MEQIRDELRGIRLILERFAAQCEIKIEEAESFDGPCDRCGHAPGEHASGGACRLCDCVELNMCEAGRSTPEEE